MDAENLINVTTCSLARWVGISNDEGRPVRPHEKDRDLQDAVRFCYSKGKRLTHRLINTVGAGPCGVIYRADRPGVLIDRGGESGRVHRLLPVVGGCILGRDCSIRIAYAEDK